MALLDLFRTQPAWKHADPEVRVEALRKLDAGEQELLLSLAREDDDPRVRRAALRRLASPTPLAALLSDERDEAVRQEALETLAGLALHASELPLAQEALAALSEPRALVQIAREARLAELRQSAVERLDDAKALSSLARTAEDAQVRLGAVHRLGDPAALAEIAQKSEHKAVALAAVEKLTDETALRQVAARARHRAAARRADARLEQLRQTAAPASGPAAPDTTASDAEDLARWAAAEAAERERLAAQEQRERDETAAREARVACCERIENLFEGQLAEELAGARSRWMDLPSSPSGPDPDLEERFETALKVLEARIANQAAREALRPQVVALCDEAAALQATGDLAAARKVWSALERRWEELRDQGAGDSELNARFQEARLALRARSATDRAESSARHAEHRARLVELCEGLEALAALPQLSLKEADARLKAAREALNDPEPLASKAERDALLARLKAARAAVYPRFQQARQDAEWRRFAAEGVRETAWQRLQALKEETDLDKLDRELREIDRLWRQAGSGKENTNEALAGFAPLRDELRARADEFVARRTAEQRENLEKKRALVAQAEALAQSGDWKATAEALQKLQAEWQEVGPVPHDQAQALWRRFRKPCDEFFTRRKADLDQRKQVWAQNMEKKQALIARAVALKESSEWDAAAAELKRLQAEWKTSGPVRPAQSEAVWKRFRGACDEFFARYKQRDQIEQQEHLAEREALVAEFEALAAEEQPSGDLKARFFDLHARWRQAKPAPRAAQAPLEERQVAARNSLLARFPDAFRGTDFDPEANRERRERLCEKAEALLARAEASEPGAGEVSLAEQLRSALAANALGGKAAGEARHKALADELVALRAAWGRLGPAAGEVGAMLQARFEQTAARLGQRLRVNR